MKKATLYLIICCLYLSCTKDEVIVVNPSNGKALQLNIDQVINDSTIVLKWTKYSGPDFKKYLLVRRATYLKNGYFETFSEPVDSSTDENHVSFTEKNMPLARDIYYYIYAYKDSSRQLPATAYVYYPRPNSLVYGIPTDVLINKQQKWVYVTEQQKISIVDYTSGRQKVSKEFPTSIGFCSLGEYNGSNELYVPVNDGWLHILDAATLQLKDRIYVAGFGIGSVVAAKGKLFVSSSDRSGGGYSNCVKVYDRATKAFVARTGYSDQTRLTVLEGSSIELIDLTISSGPGDLFYYQFNADGMLLSKKEDTYHGDYSMDARIVRSFPDGSKFITSSSGTILNKSLVFDRYIKQNGGFTDFAFNNDGSIIYAADGIQKKIDVVTYPGTTTTGNYPTAFYPYKVFRDDNMLICVGKTTISQQMTYLFIEKINL